MDLDEILVWDYFPGILQIKGMEFNNVILWSFYHLSQVRAVEMSGTTQFSPSLDSAPDLDTPLHSARPSRASLRGQTS